MGLLSPGRGRHPSELQPCSCPYLTAWAADPLQHSPETAAVLLFWASWQPEASAVVGRLHAGHPGVSRGKSGQGRCRAESLGHSPRDTVELAQVGRKTWEEPWHGAESEAQACHLGVTGSLSCAESVPGLGVWEDWLIKPPSAPENISGGGFQCVAVTRGAAPA